MVKKSVDVREAANRLHHLSMRYVGAFAEIAKGEPVGLLPQGAPGLKEMRDLIDLVLLTRAEISGLSKILIEAKITTVERLTEVMAEEYEYLAIVKANQLGVEIFDGGLKFKKPE
jgi:hypothetical protein